MRYVTSSHHQEWAYSAIFSNLSIEEFGNTLVDRVGNAFPNAYREIILFCALIVVDQKRQSPLICYYMDHVVRFGCGKKIERKK